MKNKYQISSLLIYWYPNRLRIFIISVIIWSNNYALLIKIFLPLFYPTHIHRVEMRYSIGNDG